MGTTFKKTLLNNGFKKTGDGYYNKELGVYGEIHSTIAGRICWLVGGCVPDTLKYPGGSICENIDEVINLITFN